MKTARRSAGLYEDLTARARSPHGSGRSQSWAPVRHKVRTDGRGRTRIRAWSDIYSTLRLPLGALRLPLLPRSQILAIAIVTDIAINADRPVREREIMLRLGLPKRHLRSLLHALVRNGIVTHRIGRSGGYELARAHYLISADDIVHAVADIDKVDGSKVQSLIGTEVVIPALRQADKALSEALRCLTIDMLAHSAMNKGLVVSGGQHLTRKRSR